MGAQYNPDEIGRLITEAREDDARMMPRPWTDWPGIGDMTSMPRVKAPSPGGGTQPICIANAWGAPRAIAEAIARTRNNLRPIADQLEAARSRVAELETMREALDRAAAENNQGGDPTELAQRVMDQVQSQPYSIVYALAKQVMRDHQHTLLLMVEIEAARTRVAELESERTSVVHIVTYNNGRPHSVHRSEATAEAERIRALAADEIYADSIEAHDVMP